MKTLALLLFAFASVLPARAVDVAVSIRYLQPKGKSHAAIFLFTGEGQLVRRLTDPGEDQDYAPVFSPDGREIVFVRVDGKEEKLLFIVDRAGKKTRVIEGDPPAWYAGQVVARDFGGGNSFGDDHPAEADGTRVYPSPDGELAMILRPDPTDEQHPLAFLRVGKGAPEPLAQMPGFAIFWFVTLQEGNPFLITPKLRVAFFGGDHDSTMGTRTYALDVDRRNIVELSENGAEVYPWPGHNGFFVEASSRYEPLDDVRTVNCSYLDCYDASMKRVRFGRPLGIFGGASVFVKGEKPFTLPYRGFTN